ncbi:helix-turn-helix domain-containing protein [Aquihabitans daechungensis]|uniref:helix-turn-helix domain-containing protein n=1 Tax=Aquihabitans daechungensis TaxID=1052257 RepID=UPI003B9E9B23
MQPADTLPSNLKRIRLARGWSFDDAAAATGMDAEVLEGIERGATFISRSRVDEIAARLQVDVRELLGPA